MKDKGFILLYRDILDWEWVEDAYVFKLFICLILLAEHKTVNYKGIKVERGSVLTSIEKLSLKAHMSKNSVRHSLEKLLKTGEIIEQVKPNKYRLITINNYKKYQGVGSSRDNSRDNRRDNKKDNSRDNRRDNKKDNSRDNRRDTYNNNIFKDILNNQTSVCALSAHTQEEAAPPRAPLGERERAEQPRYEDVRRFQIEKHIGGGEIATEFFNGFEKSGTLFPKNWQRVYTKFANAPRKNRDEFIDKLESGGYREKWGAVE